jgi:hypothetical protein
MRLKREEILSKVAAGEIDADEAVKLVKESWDAPEGEFYVTKQGSLISLEKSASPPEGEFYYKAGSNATEQGPYLSVSAVIDVTPAIPDQVG